MDVISLPEPDNTHSVEADLTCEMCLKSYQRRDLLMRHRRRCQGPRKSINRRKACDACVQAKTKCSYTQPICLRCAKRGMNCVYAISSATSTSDRSEARSETEAADNLRQSLQSSSSQVGNFTNLSDIFDLELPAWDFSASQYSSETFDSTLADITDPPPVTHPRFTATRPFMVYESPELTPSSQTLSLSSVSRGNRVHAALEPSSSYHASSMATPPSSSNSLAIIRVLSEYPSLLMKGSFFSPFLHLSMYSLYSNAVPDMTLLPLTSMAVCCGSGINVSDGKRFFRRAIEAARQRLIGSFPTYQCMQQWDALHAMLIYESLELRESLSDESVAWKHNPRVKGLGSPFLLKMTECYLRSYPEIRNPDISAFSDPNSSPCSAATSTWARWRITETARRTIFFANILNFYSNRDCSTGKQSPYYESLNDELILNMPLPCSQAAWLAHDEENWRAAVKMHPPSANHLSSDIYRPGFGSLSSEIFLKTIFSKFTKADLQVKIGTNVGFGGSEELKRLIVLSASEQFS